MKKYIVAPKVRSPVTDKEVKDMLETQRDTAVNEAKFHFDNTYPAGMSDMSGSVQNAIATQSWIIYQLPALEQRIVCFNLLLDRACITDAELEILLRAFEVDPDAAINLKKMSNDCYIYWALGMMSDGATLNGNSKLAKREITEENKETMIQAASLIKQVALTNAIDDAVTIFPSGISKLCAEYGFYREPKKIAADTVNENTRCCVIL